MKNDKGLGTLEYAIVLTTFLLLMLGAYDVVNILRGTSAAKQAATLGASHLSRLDKNSPLGPRVEEATRLAEGELRAAFPRANFECLNAGNPFCSDVVMNIISNEATAEVTFSLPMMLLPGSPRILRGFSESKMEDSFLPDHRAKFNNSYYEDEE